MSLYKKIAENDINKQLLHAQLQRALNNKNYILATELLEKGADIHHNGDNLLLGACESGNLEVAQFLLDHGADVQNDFALYMSFVNGHVNIINLLFDRGANLEDAPIKEMTMWENFALVKFLIEKGVVLKNNETAIEGLILSGSIDMFELYKEHDVTVEMIEKVLEENSHDLQMDDYHHSIPIIKKWCDTIKLEKKIKEDLDNTSKKKLTPQSSKNKI